MDERLIKKVERHHAHFHRVLSQLLRQLVQQPGTTWLFESGHHFAENYQDNHYHKALYPVHDITPFEAELEELQGVQSEAVTILGVKRPPHGMLLPQVLTDVHFARLRRHENYSVKRLGKPEVLGRYQSKLENALAALESFRAHAWGEGEDKRLAGVVEEVRALERGLARLEACDDELYREHFRFERVPVSVYTLWGEMKQHHVRDVGLILVGPDVKIGWADGVRRKRNDMVAITPLLALGSLEVYSHLAWQEAAEALRGS